MFKIVDEYYSRVCPLMTERETLLWEILLDHGMFNSCPGIARLMYLTNMDFESVMLGIREGIEDGLWDILKVYGPDRSYIKYHYKFALINEETVVKAIIEKMKKRRNIERK